MILKKMRHSIINFAEKQAKDTYLWTFKNMAYELKEVEALYSGIITHNLYNI